MAAQTAIVVLALGLLAALVAVRLVAGAWHDLRSTTEDLSRRLEDMSASLQGQDPSRTDQGPPASRSDPAA